MIDIRLKSPGWIKSLEEEMSVDRICGSIPTSASSTLLAEDTDMGDDDYDMEGEEGWPINPNLNPQKCGYYEFQFQYMEVCWDFQFQSDVFLPSCLY